MAVTRRKGNRQKLPVRQPYDTIRSMKRIILGVVDDQVQTNNAATADFLIRLEAAASKWSLPLEVVPSPAVPDGDWQGILLSQGQAPRPWIQALEGPVVVLVPFAQAGARKPSWLLWAHEDVSKMRIAAGTRQTAQLETNVLTLEAARNCAEVGLQYATENAPSSCAWIHAGWGDLEDFALQQAKDVFEDRLAILPIEAAAKQATGTECQVWMGISKTALPLARLLGTQCWLAFHRDSQRFVAQTTGNWGSSLLLWAIMNRLGYFTEADRVWEEAAHHANNRCPIKG